MQTLTRPMQLHELDLVLGYLRQLDGRARSALNSASQSWLTLACNADLQEQLAAELQLRDDQQRAVYFVWEVAGQPIGHASIAQIQYGDTARLEFHIWDPEWRHVDAGMECLRASVEIAFDRFRLAALSCQTVVHHQLTDRLLGNVGFVQDESDPERWQFLQTTAQPRSKTRIETERLVLREFELSDAEDVFRFATDTQVTRYTGDAGVIQSLDVCIV